MSTPTILPWHREAAKEIYPWIPADEGIGTLAEMQAGYDDNESNLQEEERIVKIIARHDPHAAQYAETRRLLAKAHEWLDGSDSRISAQSKLANAIRAHLAATQPAK